MSVRAAHSQGGHYVEPQITVVIFPDCSALEANVLHLTPFSSNSLSDPSLLADGQLGATFQVCQDLLVLSLCSNHSLKDTQLCFPAYGTRTNALFSVQKYFADEPWPNRVHQGIKREELTWILCLLTPAAKTLQTSRVTKKPQEPFKVISQMA